MIPAAQKSIFYFSATDYGFLTQRPQQLFKEWTSNYCCDRKFYYVEPFRSEINLRPATVPDVLRTPFYFHFTKYGLGQLEFINRFFITRLTDKKKPKSKVAIACTSMWEPYLDKNSFDLICYDYLDALEVHAGARNFALMKERHERLLEKSDVVFVTAEKLKQEVCAAHPQKKVVTVSNGVDPEYFVERRNATSITDYRRSNRKVVGYVGAIYDWIDLELVHAAARLTPELDYVMVGPVSGNNEAVAAGKPDNVFFLGSKSYQEVPSYIDLFDVCLIPFVKSNISESTDPIKLYEYFALGKPVVCTPMLQLKRFNDGARLIIAETAAPFADAVRSMLETDDPEKRLVRQQVARDNSWASKAAIMIESIDTLLGRS